MLPLTLEQAAFFLTPGIFVARVPTAAEVEELEGSEEGEGAAMEEEE